MINIILKCQEKNICKKVHSIHHHPTWFLAPMCVVAPKWKDHKGPNNAIVKRSNSKMKGACAHLI